LLFTYPDILSASLSALGVSLVVTLLLVMLQHWVLAFSVDHPGSGIQKLHLAPVPRVGGLAILLGVLTFLLLYDTHGERLGASHTLSGMQLLLYTLPVFLVGLLEDCTHAVTPSTRLLVAAGCSVWMSLDAGIVIAQTHVAPMDALLELPIIAVAFTAFALAGFTHAVNIIDGLNGLASGICISMLAGLALVAHDTHHLLVVELSVAGICGLIGFCALNYPRGKIFMGDGGAYFIGLWIAICATVLMMQAQVSALQMIAVCGYPVIETLFSIYRRSRHRSPLGQPDRMHLHSLVYRRVALRLQQRRDLAPWYSHGLTTALIVGANAVFVTAAVTLGDTPTSGLIVFACEIGAYVMVYRRLVRFRWVG
jgi:UDP-N-acetylmuramyl pentapeptide phosphotransferase/UDP-N-acetylglucosamine-1-phosphate transferase